MGETEEPRMFNNLDVWLLWAYFVQMVFDCFFFARRDTSGEYFTCTIRNGQRQFWMKNDSIDVIQAFVDIICESVDFFLFWFIVNTRQE